MRPMAQVCDKRMVRVPGPPEEEVHRALGLKVAGFILGAQEPWRSWDDPSVWGRIQGDRTEA